MATIKDVAARANVSFKTVARVLNGEPHVRSELIERVQAAVAELGYRPTEAARQLASRKSNVIAAPIFPFAASFVSRMLISLTKECRLRRHYLLAEVLDDRAHLLDWTSQMPVEPHAVILFAPFSDDIAVIEALERRKIPVVRIAPSVPGGCGKVTHRNPPFVVERPTLLGLSRGSRELATNSDNWLDI